MLRNCLCQKIYTVEEVYLLFILKKEYPPKPLDFKLHKQAEITWVSFSGCGKFLVLRWLPHDMSGFSYTLTQMKPFFSGCDKFLLLPGYSWDMFSIAHRGHGFGSRELPSLG